MFFRGYSLPLPSSLANRLLMSPILPTNHKLSESLSPKYVHEMCLLKPHYLNKKNLIEHFLKSLNGILRCHSQIQKVGLHLDTTSVQESSQPVSAPPSFEPFFTEESNSLSKPSSPPPFKVQNYKINRHFIFRFLPLYFSQKIFSFYFPLLIISSIRRRFAQPLIATLCSPLPPQSQTLNVSK